MLITLVKRFRLMAIIILIMGAFQPTNHLQATRVETYLKAGIIAPLLAGFCVERSHAPHCPRCHYHLPQSFPYLYKSRGWIQSIGEIVRNAGGASLLATFLCNLSITHLEVVDLIQLPAAILCSYIVGNFFGARV